MDNKPKDPKALHDAFTQFNGLYLELQSAYQDLQSQVATLTSELEFAKRKNDNEAQSRHQLRSKYSEVLNLLPAGVVVLNARGEIIEANPFAVELFGMPVMGRKWLHIIAECFAPQTDDGHEVTLLNGKRVKLETSALQFEPGQIILITDQTATRNLQKKVSQNERLSALGKMSSALAHQIRTPLSAALLNAGNLRDMPLSREQSQRIAGKLSNNLQQLEGQVRDMLVFSRANIPLQDKVLLSDLYEAIAEQLSQEFAEAQVAFKLAVAVADDQHAIEQPHSLLSAYALTCNRATLLGAISNLLNNALQASEIGQVVTCYFILHEGESECCLDLAIKDCGQGIRGDLLERINQGENFATSKAQGTGLGLTVVRAVSAAHNAHFTIESPPAEGVTAKISGLSLSKQPLVQWSANNESEQSDQKPLVTAG